MNQTSEPREERATEANRERTSLKTCRGSRGTEGWGLSDGYCARDRAGGFKLLRLTAKKRMRATLAKIRETLMRRRHEPPPTVGAWLRRVVQGYFNYHAVPGNLKRLDGFRSEVCRAWRQALRRRSQRHRLDWPRLNRIARRHIPYCRQVHPHPKQRFDASRP